MATTNVLARYTNGNCEVTLHEDGTKWREWPDGSVAQPEFPESIDLKITEMCDAGCPWCHENATKDGRHASARRIVSVVEGLPPGVEIAIGGGNPLTHPGLCLLLQAFKSRGLVSNITVNGGQVMAGNLGVARPSLHALQDDGLLHGIGISNPEFYRLLLINDMLPRHSVCHAIVGVNAPLTAIRLRAAGSNVLVLGYKSYGRGEAYHDTTVDVNIGKWRYFASAILAESKGVLSFDNLALEQLRIKEMIPLDVWARHYMGDDGRFSMYYDAVANQYAVSSTSMWYEAGGMTIREMFQECQPKGDGNDRTT
jgi:hypothetical protein